MRAGTPVERQYVRWTQALDDEVIALINQGESRAQAAQLMTAKHGVTFTRQQIGARVFRLRNGSRAQDIHAPAAMAKVWTPAERRRLLALRQTAGGIAGAAAALGRSRAACQNELVRIHNGLGVIDVPEQVRRPCITCRTPFPSAGPGNRMCDGCRSQATAEHVVIHAMGVV
ncbi:MAG: hypothetical protein P1U65_07680 [Minwuia sp.]|nr:hypothetical protein [Minwuia sp.]